MYKKTIDIILYDQSIILTTGLASLINTGISNIYRVITCNNHDNFGELLQPSCSQILIAIPEVLDEFNKKDYPKLQKVCLVYAYYDIKTLKKHEGIIQINDSSFQILGMINGLKHEEKPNLIASTSDGLLSTREVEVLKLLVSGLSTKNLSEQLFISVHTVNNHRKNIIKKLGISTISGLTIYAVINDLIDPKKVMDSMK